MSHGPGQAGPGRPRLVSVMHFDFHVYTKGTGGQVGVSGWTGNEVRVRSEYTSMSGLELLQVANGLLGIEHKHCKV